MATSNLKEPSQREEENEALEPGDQNGLQHAGTPQEQVLTEQTTLAFKFARFIPPNVLAMMGMSCYILADTYFVANGCGESGLAALNYGIVAYTVLNALGLLIGIGSGTAFQIEATSGNRDEANRIFTTALMMVAATAAFLMILVEGFTEPLAYLLGARADTMAQTVDYMRVMFWFAPVFLLNQTMLPMIRNDGKPQLAMAATVVGTTLNIFFDWLFVMVFQWDMWGAALATGTTPLFGLLIMSVHLIKRQNTFHVVRCGFSVVRAARSLVLGLSSFAVELSSGLVLLLLNLIILYFAGTVGVAAYGIVANFALVVVALFVGVGQGLQPIASWAYACGRSRDLARLLLLSSLAVAVIAVVCIGLTWAFTEPIVWAFNRDNDPELTKLAVWGMRVYFVGFVFAGFNIMASAFFSAVAKPSVGLFISICRGFIGVVVAVAVLAILFQMPGVWAAFPAAEAATFALSAVLLGRYAVKECR